MESKLNNDWLPVIQWIGSTYSPISIISLLLFTASHSLLHISLQPIQIKSDSTVTRFLNATRCSQHFSLPLSSIYYRWPIPYSWATVLLNNDRFFYFSLSLAILFLLYCSFGSYQIYKYQSFSGLDPRTSPLFPMYSFPGVPLNFHVHANDSQICESQTPHLISRFILSTLNLTWSKCNLQMNLFFLQASISQKVILPSIWWLKLAIWKAILSGCLSGSVS